NPLFKNIDKGCQVWMSHGDTITSLPKGFDVVASTKDVKIAAYHLPIRNVFGIQFHPEVYHTTQGTQMLHNFLFDICGCVPDWSPASFVAATVEELRNTLGNDKVVLGLSG